MLADRWSELLLLPPTATFFDGTLSGAPLAPNPDMPGYFEDKGTGPEPVGAGDGVAVWVREEGNALEADVLVSRATALTSGGSSSSLETSAALGTISSVSFKSLYDLGPTLVAECAA